MAPATSLTIDEMVQAIKTDGFLFLKDAAKGVQAEEFGGKRFPITTNEGIDFCKAHTFRDPVRRCCYPFSPPHLTGRVANYRDPGVCVWLLLPGNVHRPSSLPRLRAQLLH